MVISPRKSHYRVSNDAAGPKGSESPLGFILPKGSIPVHSPERVESTKTPEHTKEHLNFDRDEKGNAAKEDQRPQNGVSTSPTTVVPTQFYPDQIYQIPTSSVLQTPFEVLYDKNGFCHNESCYNEDESKMIR